MVSSTFTDLKEHRNALIQSISKHDMHPVGMEFSDAKLTGDVVDASLGMVAKSAGYVLIIGRMYGQTPECPTRNPDKLSITELEYREAVRLKRPVLLFLMGDKHPRIESEIELDADKRTKLAAFRELAKRSAPGSAVNRVYGTFECLEQLEEIIGAPLAEMQRHLGPKEPADPPPPAAAPHSGTLPSIPIPPAFYAEPDYIGSHKFVGRVRELEDLSDWAKPADPTNLLLFEAIGGNGKSMLTWEWATKHAPNVRSGKDAWAGRFWYSFYEEGAIMADFCRRALAYMTQKPLEEFAKKKTAELTKELLAQLHARPWLLILDGLERVLVNYHRIDAAEVPDEEANTPTDKILNRDPCDAIRDEDNDLLRRLAAAAPSKLLVSSRLTPRVLLNPSNQPITGARRITLPGLRPPDAEQLLRSCGITENSETGIVGDSATIQSYLTTNCDNHPLVIGVLGGLISNYLPDRGNFDTWVADPQAGAALDLASLDLVQRRNHILRAALKDLSQESHQLLSTLALLTDSVDYETLKAFNPHLPPEPKTLKEPTPPERKEFWKNNRFVRWKKLSDNEKTEEKKKYETALAEWQNYEKTIPTQSVEFSLAPKKLETTVSDLEQRGLLQWDGRERKYNLHAVVRGVASGGIAPADRESQGQRVLDYFSARPHRPYEEAETLEDLRSGLHVVRSLIKLGRFQKAAEVYCEGLEGALMFNIEAHAETLSLLRPFFPTNWSELSASVSAPIGSSLMNGAANALTQCGEETEALAVYSATLRSSLKMESWDYANSRLINISSNLIRQNLLAKAHRVDNLGLELATVQENQECIFVNQRNQFAFQSLVGKWTEADSTWHLMVSMGRNWSRSAYRPGNAESNYALFHFYKGTLEEKHLTVAEGLVKESKDRALMRTLHILRGEWRLVQGEWAQAAASYQESLRLARERSLPDADSETGLALAKLHLGQLTDPHHEAERLAQLRKPYHLPLAQLWLALGNSTQAQHHALAAYKWAWADGEPFVRRYELTKTTELLQQMGVPIPQLPPYDSAKDVPFPWEAEVRAAVEKLRTEKEAIAQENRKKA